LPELIKNAKDQYSRLRVIDRGERQIVVIADTVRRHLGVIDFAGASARDFTGWMTWSSRTANRRDMAPDIEGGHGNGGKAFMVRGSTTYSFIESFSNGKLTRMGFTNDDPAKRYFPGYGKEGGTQMKDRPETNPRGRLGEILKALAIKEDSLPQPAIEVFVRRKAYTAVVIGGVQDWRERRRAAIERSAAEIVSSLRVHPQAALTLETSSLWVLIDGRLVTREPIAVEYPEPFKGFEEPISIRVPQSLPDPKSDELIDTGAGEPGQKRLLLRTSDKQLRMTDEGKAINVIRVKNSRTVVANWSLAELVPRAESAFILGELLVPVLEGEFLQDSHRSELAETPLARALRFWVTAQADDLARKIQKLQAHETKEEERSRANSALEEFRKLMRKYLESDDVPGLGDASAEDGDADSNSGKRPPPPPRPPGQRIDQIVLEQGRDVVALAVGTNVPLIARCYESQESGEKRLVPNVHLEFHTEPPGVFGHESGALLAADEGIAEIWVRDNESGMESNRVLAEAVRCTGVDVVGPDEILKQGQRVRLLVSFQTVKGRRDDLLVQGWIDETDLGRVSRNGSFTAGMAPGTATIRVRFGPSNEEVGVATLEIGHEIQERKGPRGGDVPYVLICGDDAPGMEEYPADQRTHHGGERHPTVIEEPQFPHIVWINHGSKESLRVRQSRGGSRGVGGIASKSFREFLALKCFEILKRLRVRQAIGDREVPEREFTRELAQAEMDCAGFVDAAFSLADNLRTDEEGE
jgi:hypothetical protein